MRNSMSLNRPGFSRHFAASEQSFMDVCIWPGPAVCFRSLPDRWVDPKRSLAAKLRAADLLTFRASTE